jgi:hypothetical protein
MVDSSFYADGEVYDTAVVETNDHGASLTPSQAPSGFYPGGTVYNEADTEAAAAYVDEAAVSAASAAASAASAAASGVTAVANAAGTATPIVDGTAAVGSSPKWAHEDHVHPTDTSRAPLDSPGFTGTPTAPLAAINDNSSKLATTAFLQQQGANALPAMDGTAAIGAALKWARQDHVHPTDTSRASVTYVDAQDALKAPLASPALTGTPTAPTPSAGDNSTKLATTAFAKTYADGLAGTLSPAMDGTQAVGTSTKWAHEDHVHPTDTSRAPVASPSFTGTPAAPTPTAGDASTKIATTQFVATAVSSVTTPSGAPIKVAQTVDTTNRAVSSTSYTATGSASATYTPASASNKLRVQVAGIKSSSASASVHVTLFRSINGGAWTDITPAGAGELCASVITSSVLADQVDIDLVDSPATTLPVQYQVYMKSNAASTIYLGRRAADTLLNTPTVFTVTEIKG